METRRSAYRGDHVHHGDKFTVLLEGALMIVKQVDGGLVEQHLERDRVYVTAASVPHKTVALEDRSPTSGGTASPPWRGAPGCSTSTRRIYPYHEFIVEYRV